MKIAIRADASVAIGSGHVMRCAALADGLRERGAQVVFVCRTAPGDMGGWLAAAGFEVRMLPAAQWSWQDDAAQVLALLDGEAIDAIVVDHYGLDARWEEQAARIAPVMAIDDLADRPHACELLLDQNLYDDGARRYDGLVPVACECLLGPRYALLRPQFADARSRRRPQHRKVERVLVCFGGSDAGNETAKGIEALRLLGGGLAADVVIGGGNPHRRAIEQLCASLPWTRLLVQAEDMAQLMLDADLCIGAGGSTTWERCCVGLPGILVAVADNQVQAMRTLSRHGCVHFMGMASDVSARDLADAVAALMASPERLAALADNGLRLVDGEGVSRVAERLMAMAGQELKQ